MKKIKFRCFKRYNSIEQFLQESDLLPDSSKIGSSTILSFIVDKEDIEDEYIENLIKHIESMTIGEFRYENVKLIAVE